MDFAVLADNRVKIKENEKKGKYLDFAREQTKLKVTVIPITNGALGTILKALARRLEEKSEDEPRLYKLQHCWGLPGYGQESWSLVETWCSQTTEKDHQLTLFWKINYWKSWYEHPDISSRIQNPRTDVIWLHMSGNVAKQWLIRTENYIAIECKWRDRILSSNNSFF